LKDHEEPFEEVDPATIDGMAPASDSRVRAIRISGEGMVSSRDLHRAYDAVLTRTPGLDVLDTEVDGIVVEGTTKVLRTKAGLVRARVVVIAAGARSQEIVDRLELGARIPRLVAGIGVAIVLRVASPRPRDVIRCLGENATGGPYVVPYEDDHLYVGATSHLALKGTTSAPPAAVESLLEAVARHVAPRIREAPIVRTLVGWRPTTLDTYPLIGETSIEGIWMASGTKRDGLHLSPRIAEELTRCIAGSERPFSGAFLPERALRLDVPRAVAIERTVASLTTAARSSEHGATPATADELRAFEERTRRDVLEVYARTGLAAEQWGIPVELFEMYRHGAADANLAYYRTAQTV
jgi:glycine oxidase